MISVIIPVYNTELYIRECINSLLAQTYKDFEVILVDDGSTDQSGKRCDEYAILDERIRTIHIANSGVTAARKKGVEISKGEWITFVDSDDTLPQEALARYAEHLTNNTDIIIGQTNINRPDILSHIPLEDYREGLMNGTFRVDACGKLIRRSIFSSAVLDIPRNIKVGEDMLMHIRLSFQTVKDVYALSFPNHTYNYRSHERQCSMTFKRTFDYEEMFHKHLIESIPDDVWHKYIEASIKSRLNALRIIIMENPLTKGFYQHNFYIQLYDDIKKTSYPLSWRDKLFLEINTKALRYLLVVFVKLYTKFR